MDLLKIITFFILSAFTLYVEAGVGIALVKSWIFYRKFTQYKDERYLAIARRQRNLTLISVPVILITLGAYIQSFYTYPNQAIIFVISYLCVIVAVVAWRFIYNIKMKAYLSSPKNEGK